MKNKENKFVNRIKGHTELILGLSLAIPIILLYLFGLMVTPRKTYMVISTSLVILVFFVGAISLDLEVGSVGLPNFGKVAFFAIGAYTSTLLYNYFGVPFPVAVVIALIVSSGFGYLISIPAVKLRADYFAIMTIAGGEVIRLVLQYEQRWLWDPTTNTQTIANLFTARVSTSHPFNKYLSDFGITIFKDLGLGTIFIWELTLLIVFIIISILVYLFVQQIRKSPYGRTLRAIREDDITVTSVGKDVGKFRWQVTTVSAFIAGIAGVMYATLFNSLDATNFTPGLTFQLYYLIIIGGLGNSKGAFAGTTLVTLFLRGTAVREVQNTIKFSLDSDTPIIGSILQILQLELDVNPFNLRFVILGSMLIAFLLFKPAGLIPEPRIDNEKYLKLLTPEERLRSDEAVEVRQSLTEKERIEVEKTEESVL